MIVNKWITDNYEDLKTTTYNILGEDNFDEVDELLHTCIEMFLNNKNAEAVVEKGQAKWFFIRILLNQHRSKTSYYHKTYRRNKNLELLQSHLHPQHLLTQQVDLPPQTFLTAPAVFKPVLTIKHQPPTAVAL